MAEVVARSLEDAFEQERQFRFSKVSGRCQSWDGVRGET